MERQEYKAISTLDLFKVSRTDKMDYDQYSDFVCAAESEDAAMLMYPDEDFENGYLIMGVGEHGEIEIVDERLDEYLKLSYHEKWARNIKDLKVEHIGVADSRFTKPCIIVASFHAA